MILTDLPPGEHVVGKCGWPAYTTPPPPVNPPMTVPPPYPFTPAVLESTIITQSGIWDYCGIGTLEGFDLHALEPLQCCVLIKCRVSGVCGQVFLGEFLPAAVTTPFTIDVTTSPPIPESVCRVRAPTVFGTIQPTIKLNCLVWEFCVSVCFNQYHRSALGDYTITWTLTDAAGRTCSASHTVHIARCYDQGMGGP